MKRHCTAYRPSPRINNGCQSSAVSVVCGLVMPRPRKMTTFWDKALIMTLRSTSPISRTPNGPGHVPRGTVKKCRL